MDYRLQRSIDKEVWYDVDKVENNKKNITDRYVPQFTARYLRLIITDPASFGDKLKIIEFEVYGK